jgi:predicted regulator of Ras-like GTPase activity (Roadblock/LC7/MglB family)
MVKRRKSIHETSTTVIMEDETDVSTVEEDQTFTNLRTNLAEINKCEGILGYILRNATSATIDLKDPAKLVEYAILSSQALDSSQEISELFNIGEIESVLIEGKDTKALCMAIGENKVSIFMEKNTDHADILKRVAP